MDKKDNDISSLSFLAGLVLASKASNEDIDNVFTGMVGAVVLGATLLGYLALLNYCPWIPFWSGPAFLIFLGVSHWVSTIPKRLEDYKSTEASLKRYRAMEDAERGNYSQILKDADGALQRAKSLEVCTPASVVPQSEPRSMPELLQPARHPKKVSNAILCLLLALSVSGLAARYLLIGKREAPETVRMSSTNGKSPNPGAVQTIQLNDGSNQMPDREARLQVQPNGSTGMINTMLQAIIGGDENLFDQLQARLVALPKPVPGDNAEATRLNKLGLAELRAKNYVEAAQYFSKAFDIDPSDPKLLSNLGYAETFAGDLPSAEKHLCASICLDPARAVCWSDLGLLYAKRGKQDDAVASLLIGHKISNGQTLGFLKSLQTDDDPAVRAAGAAALNKVGQ